MITITKYTMHKEGVLGAWKYWHLIQYKEGGYKYDLNMTDEGMGYLIDFLKRAGNEVTFLVKQ